MSLAESRFLPSIRPMTTTREQPNERSNRERLAEGLARAYPGLAIVEEDLEIGDGRVVDLVGVDARGRLVLARSAAATDDAALLDLMATAAFARTHFELLVGHLGQGHLSPASPPLAVLIAPTVSSGFVDRLEVLRPDVVRVFEERTISSARAGRVTYLRSVYPPTPLERPLPSPGATRFVRALPDDLRPRAEELVRRMARVDDEIESDVSETSVDWTIGGRRVGTVRFEDGYLYGEVPPQARPLRLDAGVESEGFLTAVLERCVALIGPRVASSKATVVSIATTRAWS